MSDSKLQETGDIIPRINARLGTAEFQKQVEQQSQGSFAFIFRMTIVRIACGIFGIVFFVEVMTMAANLPNDPTQLLSLLVWAGFALECLSIAILGKSQYLCLFHKGRGQSMPGLVVNDVEPAILAKLKERAEAHHQSIEDEHRAILRDVLLADGQDAPATTFEA